MPLMRDGIQESHFMRVDLLKTSYETPQRVGMVVGSKFPQDLRDRNRSLFNRFARSICARFDLCTCVDASCSMHIECT